jgi:hypothetical protein
VVGEFSVSDAPAPNAATTRDGAVAALRALGMRSPEDLDGVLLLTDLFEPAQKMSYLKPTVDGAAAILEITNFVSNRMKKMEVIDYGAAATTADGQLMWIALDQVPLLGLILEGSSDFANLDEFDPRTTKLSKAGLAAIRLATSNASTVFVQALGGQQVVAKTSRTGLLIRKGVLDVPKDEMILLNRDMTAVVSGDYVFFENRRAFQNLVGLLDALRDQAETTLRSVTSSLKIQGFDELLGAVRKHPGMIGKMESIRQKVANFPAYREALTMPKILAFVRSHPECRVELSGEGDDAALVFQNDFQNQFKILKLLDDDYLKSELTTMEYETNSKSAPLG